MSSYSFMLVTVPLTSHFSRVLKILLYRFSRREATHDFLVGREEKKTDETQRGARIDLMQGLCTNPLPLCATGSSPSAVWPPALVVNFRSDTPMMNFSFLNHPFSSLSTVHA